MKFNDIPQFTQAQYRIDVSFRALFSTLDHWADYKLDTNPDFQRAHVWTEAQQIAFVEYMVQGGTSGHDIFFNHPGWMGSFKGDFVLVDGKQRLEAARRFLNDELPVFGHYFHEFDDKLPYSIGFVFHVADLKTKAEVLRWYIGMNRGGSIHTDEEIERVKALLENS